MGIRPWIVLLPSSGFLAYRFHDETILCEPGFGSAVPGGAALSGARAVDLSAGRGVDLRDARSQGGLAQVAGEPGSPGDGSNQSVSDRLFS